MSGGSASGEAGWKPCGAERARVHRADSGRAAGRAAAVGASARGAAAGGFSGARSVSPATQSAGLRGRSPSRRRRSRSASPRAAAGVLQRSATALAPGLPRAVPTGCPCVARGCFLRLCQVCHQGSWPVPAAPACDRCGSAARSAPGCSAHAWGMCLWSVCGCSVVTVWS